MNDHCIDKLNEKWTERLQQHDAIWSKRLQELNAMWSKRFQEVDSLRLKSCAELDAMWSKRFQDVDSLRVQSSIELEAMRFDRSQQQWKENEFMLQQIQNLRERIRSEEKNRIQLKQILNIHGALGHIVDQAKSAEMISPTAGIQEGLDELSKMEEFTTILEKQVETRGLTIPRVMASFHRLDSVVSKLLRFDASSTVTIPYEDFRDEERAALAILFEIQGEWPKRFWYDEEEAPDKEDEYPDYGYGYYSE